MKSSKHQLLATTALVAAASMVGGVAHAEAMKPSASLAGFFNHSTHFADQDSHDGMDKGNVSSRNNIEVFVNFAGEMENGLKVGGRVEFEGASQGGTRVDHTWVDLSSEWGMIRAGYMQSGRWEQTWAVQAPSAAYGVSSGHTHFWFDDSVTSVDPNGFRFLRPLGSVNTDIGEDQPTLTYYTPRFNGFQLTGSYRYRIDDGNTSGYGRVADENTQYSNAVDGSIHYAGGMGDVSFGVMLGAAGATAPNTGLCGTGDYTAMNAGAKASAQGFTVGAQIADVDDEARCGSGTAYQVGAMYGQGPWALSVTAIDGEVEQTDAPGDATYSAWSLGFGYTVGPGLKLVASYQSADMDGEDDADNAGQAFMAGINVGF